MGSYKLIKSLSTSRFRVVWLVGLSLAIHLSFMATLNVIEAVMPAPEKTAIKIKIKEVVKEIPVEEEKPQPPPPPPKEIPKKPKLPEQREPKKPPTELTKKIQGVTDESLSKDDKARVSVPAGNTLMEEDKGIRLSPDEIAALKKDLSADAILIQGSFVAPEYTQAALDANLQGKYIVDVFVDSLGRPKSAELRRKIGYGMDQRVKDVALSAKFIPRKNAKGVPMAGWAEIRFYLEIP